MGLETFGYIKDLVDTNPTGQDPKSQGDDHLRGIKQTLTDQFAGLTEGIPITASESDLNATSSMGAYSGRNRLINGEFDIWQRGTGFSAAGYTADRWRMRLSSSTAQLSRLTFGLGSAFVPQHSKYMASLDVTSANTGTCLCSLQQRVESVLTLQGSQATISFWARVDNAANQISFEAGQAFGTGGSPSASVSGIGVHKFSFTQADLWTYCTHTFDIPDVSGKVLGTDGNDYLSIAFWIDAGSDYDTNTDSLGNQTGAFVFAMMQLEPGKAATPSEKKPIASTLQQCKRYYEVQYADLRFLASGASQAALSPIYFETEKRVIPTMNELDVTETNTSNLIENVRLKNSASITAVSAAPGNVIVNGTYAFDAELN